MSIDLVPKTYEEWFRQTNRRLAIIERHRHGGGSGGGTGAQGPPGESAYQIAVDNGFIGTEQEWLDSLVGPEGDPGPTVVSTDPGNAATLGSDGFIYVSNAGGGGGTIEPGNFWTVRRTTTNDVAQGAWGSGASLAIPAAQAPAGLYLVLATGVFSAPTTTTSLWTRIQQNLVDVSGGESLNSGVASPVGEPVTWNRSAVFRSTGGITLNFDFGFGFGGSGAVRVFTGTSMTVVYLGSGAMTAGAIFASDEGSVAGNLTTGWAAPSAARALLLPPGSYLVAFTSEFAVSSSVNASIQAHPFTSAGVAIGTGQSSSRNVGTAATVGTQSFSAEFTRLITLTTATTIQCWTRTSATGGTQANSYQRIIAVRIDQGVPGASAPAGSVTAFAGPVVPNGYLACDGSLVSRSTYPDLFMAIGTTYGVGDGSTTFALPNLLGRVPVARDAGQPEFAAVGQAGGEKTHVLSATEMPSHGHTLAQRFRVSGDHDHQGQNNKVAQAGSSTGWTDTAAMPSAVGNTGGGAAHNNLQPYLTMLYIIKT